MMYYDQITGDNLNFVNTGTNYKNDRTGGAGGSGEDKQERGGSITLSTAGDGKSKSRTTTSNHGSNKTTGGIYDPDEGGCCSCVRSSRASEADAAAAPSAPSKK